MGKAPHLLSMPVVRQRLRGLDVRRQRGFQAGQGAPVEHERLDRAGQQGEEEAHPLARRQHLACVYEGETQGEACACVCVCVYIYVCASAARAEGRCQRRAAYLTKGTDRDR